MQHTKNSHNLLREKEETAMQHLLRLCITALLVMVALTFPAAAADEKATVKVALLDMSSLMPHAMMGYGMMGQGQVTPPPGMGQGMMMGGMGMMGMMGMMAVRIDKPTVKAGTVTFDVTNWSRSVLHEMLVIAVDNQTAPLPYDYGQARVPEEQVKVLGETEELQPNASKMFEVKLSPGSYLLICNVAGHYAVGMVTPFNVTP